MTDFSFSVIISIIMISMMIILVLSIKLQLTVKAGKVTKFCGKYALVAYQKPAKVIIGNQVVDANDMEILRVRGNSMKDYGIYTNNQVFVKQYTSEDKGAIQSHPVMVLKITDNKPWDSIYKLRKFVCYVDLAGVDWAKVYKENSSNNRIKIDKDSFVEKCTNKSKKNSIQGLDRCILSETYNEDSGNYEYSLHPVGSLYGKVCYVK